MKLPKKPVVEPACLKGQPNGKLPDDILVDVPGEGGGPVVRLVEPAARAWKALSAAMLADTGIILQATSAADSFRKYAIQERIFRDRYTTKPNGTKPRRWNGVAYYQKPGTAAAAVPGTSNHGRAIAVDSKPKGGRMGVGPVGTAAFNWLLANADRFGWSWELDSEKWHIRYYPGDNIPAAVLEFEAGGGSPAPSDDERILLEWA